MELVEELNENEIEDHKKREAHPEIFPPEAPPDYPDMSEVPRGPHY